MLGLTIGAPLLLLTALAVRLSSRGPVLFRQQRVGRGFQPFTLLKFRSMRGSPGGPRVTAGGDARVTAVGRAIRKLKLDELPELWNVLRGDMALVGPRPEVPDYVDPGDSRWTVVLSARPGLTDPVTLALRSEEVVLAAVPGDRDAFYRGVLLPWKLNGAVDYLARRSAWGDLKVIWRTLAAVVRPSLSPPPRPDQLEAQIKGEARNRDASVQSEDVN